MTGGQPQDSSAAEDTAVKHEDPEAEMWADEVKTRELREENDMKRVSNEIREEGKSLYRNTGFHNQRELGKLVY